jgi:hypothetical protein
MKDFYDLASGLCGCLLWTAAVLTSAQDYPEAGRVVAKLITASGFSPVW